MSVGTLSVRTGDAKSGGPVEVIVKPRTSCVIGRSIESSRDLTAVEASRLIEELAGLTPPASTTLPPDEQDLIDEAQELFDAKEHEERRREPGS